MTTSWFLSDRLQATGAEAYRAPLLAAAALGALAVLARRGGSSAAASAAKGSSSTAPAPAGDKSAADSGFLTYEKFYARFPAARPQA